MDPSDISVVIASHNAERFIEEAVRSVLGQTAPVREIILVDDASSDSTVRRVQATESPIPIKVTELAENVGRARARNAGCALASGSWIACLDHDDVWLPKKIQTQVEFVNAYGGELVAVGSRGRHINRDGRDLGLLDFGLNSEEEFRRLRDEGSTIVMPHSSALARKDVFDEVGGYDPDYNGADDAELWSRMAQVGTILNCPDELILFRKHPDSGSVSEFWTLSETVRWFEENHRRRATRQILLSRPEFQRSEATKSLREKLALRRRILELYCYRVGSSYLANDRRLKGAAYLGFAFASNPQKVMSGIRRYRS